jgi:hypothetical protein
MKAISLYLFTFLFVYVTGQLTATSNELNDYFTIRMFPEGTIDPTNPEHCFSSNCSQDQTTHFYLSEVFVDPFINEGCDFADLLINSDLGTEIRISEILNSFILSQL